NTWLAPRLCGVNRSERSAGRPEPFQRRQGWRWGSPRSTTLWNERIRHCEARLFTGNGPAPSNSYDSNRSWLDADDQLPPCRWKRALRARSSRTLASGSVPTARSPGTSTVGEVAASAGAAAAYDAGAGAAPTDRT